MDCDDEANKQFCGSMGVQGFPTLKIVRPGKKYGKPVVEDYEGARTASAIVADVVSKINNHVTRVGDKELDKFLEGDKPKALLFTAKGTTSALIRSVAIDYLDVVSVGQVRNKEAKAVEKFGIEKFPTFVLVPAEEGKDPIIYNGELNKKELVEFLKGHVGEPNPDPAPTKGKADKKDKKDKKDKTKAEAGKAKDKKEKPAKSESDEAADTSDETTSAEPAAAPTLEIITIPTISSEETLVEKCLHKKAHTCVLAFVPSESSENGDKVTASLSQLNTKYIRGHRHLFPFLALPSNVDGVDSLRQSLELKADVELVAINGRRQWWRRYEGDFGIESVESWIDAIRMGEGSKMKLPKIIKAEADEKAQPEETKAEETKAEEAKTEEAKAEETKAEEAEHDEL